MELQKTDNIGNLLSQENERRSLINKYIEENLTPEVDFGTITIERNGRSITSKPSLFKPGSEKMCNLFHLRPVFARDDDTWEMLGKKVGLICFKCDLVHRSGEIVGEGRGSALTAMSADFDVNKQIKIAEKRAQIDAVLRVFGLSERFTQDIEDMPREVKPQPTKISTNPNPITMQGPATFKQLNVMMAIAKSHGDHNFTWADGEKMSKQEASEWISNHGDGSYYDRQKAMMVEEREKKELAESEEIKPEDIPF